MLSECFEMEPLSRSSPYHTAGSSGTPTRSRLVKKVVDEEFDLRDLPQGTAISCWWMTLPVFYYLSVIAGGVISSISVGDVVAAFDNNCIFYANATLKGIDALNGSKVLTRDNVEFYTWGDMDSCLFPEYTSVACVMYAGILLVMVLQCGRGGGKSAFRGRGIAESWRIVPIAFLFNLIFLILSCIIFGNIQNGFSSFCDGIRQQGSLHTLGNVSSCAEVLQYSFPYDKYNTNLYMEYVLAKFGATLQLVGSLLAFLTIIVRCCLPADFVVYRRQKIMMAPGIQSSYSEDGIRSYNSSQARAGKVTTSIECHNHPHASTSQVQYENLMEINDDGDSLHSNGSDVNLVMTRTKPTISKFT